jgi:uncharacterized protein
MVRGGYGADRGSAGMTAPAAVGPLRRVIVQPTSFCNIDCDYCYLADRDSRRVMGQPVVEALARVLAATPLIGPAVEIRWHSGEPLTAPISFYRQACATLAQALSTRTRVTFSVQTNGMLINDDWCRLFRDFGFEVGVSIDGPASVHDRHRRTRRGAGTHQRALAGVAALRRNGLPFGVISVVTAELLRRGEEYRSFMAALNPVSIGLNPEESEGEHVSDLFGQSGFEAAYAEFLTAMYRFQERTGIVVRRFAEISQAISHASLPVRNEQTEPLCLLSVDADGNLSSFSPELLGWRAPAYDDFLLGNVTDGDLDLTAWRTPFARLAADVALGRSRCAQTCPYFSLCGGGAPANKWIENGSFATTVTAACRLNTMTAVDVVLAALEERV